jgi:phage gpG-like protein
MTHRAAPLGPRSWSGALPSRHYLIVDNVDAAELADVVRRYSFPVVRTLAER